MQKDLIENLLFDLNRFQHEVTEILKRPPNISRHDHIEFWIHFFLGAVITASNDQLKIKDICFCINNSVLKLGFKTQSNKIIIRYIEIVDQLSLQTSDTQIQVKNTDLSEIQTILKDAKEDFKSGSAKYIKLSTKIPDNAPADEIIMQVYDMVFTEYSTATQLKQPQSRQNKPSTGDESSSSGLNSTPAEMKFKKVEPQKAHKKVNAVMLAERVKAGIIHDSTKENSPLGEIQNMIPENQEKVHSGSLSRQKRELLLDNINGYETRIKNDFIQAAANSPDTKMSPQLHKKLVNAANKIHFAMALHLVMYACRDNNATACMLSVTGFGYSLASKPVQNILLKNTPKFIDDLAITSGKLLPKFLGYDTQFVIRVGGAKYGSKIVKGIVGTVGLSLDVISISIAARDLAECNNRDKAVNPCGNKETRDHIASISISTVSFISGGILITTGAAAGPLAITLGIAIITVTEIYIGVSAIIEYEEKYNTTHSENWSIFWRTTFFQDMAEDVQSLSEKTDDINQITEYVAQHFNNLSDETVAYAIGFGKVVLFQIECSILVPMKAVQSKYNITLCHEVPNTEILSGYSEIDLSSGVEKYDNKLSRILPNPIEGMSFTCLPALTNAIYEKEGTSHSLSSYPDVKHYCNNSMVMEHNARMQNYSITAKSVLFNLRYVNAGRITGSNTLNNIFIINNVKEKDDRDYNLAVVSGTSVENYFYFWGSSYYAKLLFSNNSINIINIAESKIHLPASKFMCTNGSILLMQKVYQNGKLTDDVRVYSEAVDPKAKFSIYYIGIKNVRDDIHCHYEAHNVDDSSDHCEYVDTVGGAVDDIDLIENCKKVILRPYTSYSSKNNPSSNKTLDTRYLYIKTDGYESDKNSFANISLSSTDSAYIIFPNISVLLDTKEVIYIPQNQTLLMKFLLSEGGIFTLYLVPYTIKDLVPNFTVLDKDGQIAPVFDMRSSSITHIEKFSIYMKIDDFKDFDQLKAKHQSVHRDDRLYKVFSTIVTSNRTCHIGSTGTDIVFIDKNTHYVFGGEEADIYIINNQWPIDGIIDNQSKDIVIDVLLVNCGVSDIEMHRYQHTRTLNGQPSNDLVLVNTVGQYLWIANYFGGKEYQHLIVIDKNNGSYIPLYIADTNKYQFIPFYHSLIDKNDFVVSSDVKEFVIAAQKENIGFYTEHNNLVVVVHNSEETETQIMVKIKDFFSSKFSIKILLYNNGNIDARNTINLDIFKANHNNPTNFNTLLDTLGTTYDNIVNLKTSKIGGNVNIDVPHDDLIDVRYVDFTEDINIMFNHKVKDGILTPVSNINRRLGVIVIHDVHPKSMTAIQEDFDLTLSASKKVGDEDTFVTIKNYFANADYVPYFLYFNFTDSDPIRIYTFNNNAYEIERKLSRASNIYVISKYFINTSIKVRDLRCAYSSYDFILKPNEIHKILGFESLEDMLIFSSKCIGDKSLLSKLRENMSAFEKYNKILLNNIALQNYNVTYAVELKKLCKDYFITMNITNFVEQLINNSLSRPSSDSDTEVRPKRSVHFNGRGIIEYNMQDDLNSSMQDAPAQMSSSASKPGSWFASVSQKIVNFVKSITKVGQQFGDSSSDRLDLDTTINTQTIDQVPLDDYTLITDSNAGNSATAILISGYFDINGILCWARFFCTKKTPLENTYISPQKAVEMQRDMVFQEVFQNLEQAMELWGNDTYEEDCFI